MEQNGASSATLQLLDGDKIATLFASFIMDQLQILKGTDSKIPGFGTARVAVIQTAYANGASTKYVKQVLGLESAVTPTGVKHLHKKAEQYDVGIYFEANGHGTVLFSDSFLQWLHDAASREEGTFRVSILSYMTLMFILRKWPYIAYIVFSPFFVSTRIGKGFLSGGMLTEVLVFCF